MDPSSIFAIPIGDIILWFVVFLFSLSFHEAAHAWTSERFGDDTGRYQGRITLNPLAHIDLLGTVLIPLMGFMKGGFSFIGWAKPVETNPNSWRNRTVANIMVAMAGPGSNLLLAVIALIAIKSMILAGVVVPYVGPMTVILPLAQDGLMVPVAKILSIFLLLNVSLAVFNMLPIPPLDGSHVMESLLPPSVAERYAAVRPYGFILLLVFLWSGIFTAIITPVYILVYSLVGGINFS
jgi:Zn-dependent protease